MSDSYIGPRLACVDLISLTDDIYNNIEPSIDALPQLSPEEKEELKKKISEELVDIFCGEKVDKLRSYIYDLWRQNQKE